MSFLLKGDGCLPRRCAAAPITPERDKDCSVICSSAGFTQLASMSIYFPAVEWCWNASTHAKSKSIIWRFNSFLECRLQFR